MEFATLWEELQAAQNFGGSARQRQPGGGRKCCLKPNFILGIARWVNWKSSAVPPANNNDEALTHTGYDVQVEKQPERDTPLFGANFIRDLGI